MSDSYSYWEQDAFLKPTDVLIVGCGFAGLWSALALKEREPSLTIRMVDVNPVNRGASTRNAGFACYGSLTELLADEASAGESEMLTMVEMRYLGLEILKKSFSADEIDYSNYGGYELIEGSRFADANQLRMERERLNKLLKPVTRQSETFIHADNDFGFKNISWLVKNNAEGQLHPGKLVQALLRKLHSRDVEIIRGVRALNFEPGEMVSLETDSSIVLKARQMLICNNAFASQLSPGLSVIPARGQVVLTSPIDNLPFKGTFHFDEGFYYFRNINNRVLLGGARNKAFEEEQTLLMDTTSMLQGELERFLREVVIPGKSFTIENRWSGIMGMSNDRMPIVKPLASNVFAAVGLGGIGVAVSPLVGKKAAALLT